MRKSEADWSTPRRQSRIAMVFSVSKFARNLLRQFWILIPILFFGQGGLKTEVAFLVLVVFFGSISVIMSIIGYFKFYFWIENGELVIRKGVLRKSEVNLPLERIQAVNLHQGVLHQMLDVYRVEIDSAGAKGREFEISALTVDEAHDLKEYLLQNARIFGAKSKNQSFQELQDVAQEQKTLLFRHSIKDLLLIGISQNHLQTAGIILVFMFGLYENLQGLFLDDLYSFVRKVLGIDLDNVWGILLIAGPLFVLVSILVTLFRTVLTEYDMRFWVTPKGFNLKSGLLQRRESIARLDKIQISHVSANPIQRKLGLHSIRLNQASSAEVSTRQSVAAAGVYENQVQTIIEHKYAELIDQRRQSFGIDPRYVVRRFLFFGILPAVGLIGFSLLSQNYKLLVWLAGLPLIYLYYRANFRRFRYELGEDLMLVRRGYLTQRRSYMEIFKIQALRIVQSPYQRRKSLCSMVLYTASGSLFLPFIPTENAHRLYNLLLYRAEKSHKHWM